MDEKKVLSYIKKKEPVATFSKLPFLFSYMQALYQESKDVLISLKFAECDLRDTLAALLSATDDQIWFPNLRCLQIEKDATLQKSKFLTSPNSFRTVFPNITDLVLCQNSISEIAFSESDLQFVERILLAFNALTTIEFPSNSGLKTLDLSHNLITKLPSLSQLKKLERLDLSFNRFTKIPSQIKKLTLLFSLNVENNQIEELPSWIGQLQDLKELLLQKNMLQSLPPEIGNLTNLKSLSLASNNLETLPNEITNLITLTTLVISQNKISQVPDLSSLKLLQNFQASDNNFVAFPRGLENCSTVIEIHLARNQIGELPNLSKCCALRKLDLSENKLSKLPHNLEENTALSNILLHNNEFEEIQELFCLSNLRIVSLTLHNNPLPGRILEWMSEYGEKKFFSQDMEVIQSIISGNWERPTSGSSSFLRGSFSSASSSPRSSPRPSRSTRSLSKEGEESPKSSQGLISEVKKRRDTTAKGSRFSLSGLVDNIFKKSSSLVPTELPTVDQSKPDVHMSPEFSEETFLSFVNSLGLEEEKKKNILSLPLESKIQLFTSSFLKSNVTPPQDFIEILKRDVQAKDLTTLRVTISSVPTLWMENFISLDGAVLLNEQLSQASKKLRAMTLEKRKTANWETQKDLNEICFEVLRILRIICEKERGPCLNLNILENLLKVLDVEKLNTKVEAIEILNKIAQLYSVGPRILIEALDRFAHSNLSRGRFLPLIAQLEPKVSSLIPKSSDSIEYLEEQLKIPHLISCSLNLLNNICDKVEDLSERWSIRKQMLDEGLLQVLVKIQDNKQFKFVVDNFHQGKSQDRDDLILKYGKVGLMKRIVQENKGSQKMKSKFKFLYLFNFTPIFTPNEMIEVPYDKNAETDVLFSLAAEEFQLDKRMNFEIVLLDTESDDNSVPLERGNKLSKYRLGSDVFAEIRLVPWQIPVRYVQYKPDKKANETENSNKEQLPMVPYKLDPLTSCAALEQRLIKDFKTEKYQEHYSIYVCSEGRSGFWVAPEQKLLAYGLNKRINTFLEFKVKPCIVNIVFPDSRTETWEFEPFLLIQDAISKIGTAQGIPEDAFSQLSLQNSRGDIFDALTSLSQWTIFFRNPVKLLIKPKIVKVDLLGKITEIELDYSKTISELTRNLTQKNQIHFKCSLSLKKTAQQEDESEEELQGSKSIYSALAKIMNQDYSLVLKQYDLGLSETGPSIWEEKRTESNLKMDPQVTTQIAAGTLNQIVSWLVESGSPEEIQIFFTTLTNFATANAVYLKIQQKFQVPPQVEPKKATEIQNRIKHLLQVWKTICVHDQTVQSLLENVDVSSSSVSPLAPAAQKLDVRTSISGTFERKDKNEILTFFENNEAKIVAHLTNRTWSHYSRITVSELLGQNWTSSDSSLSPNVLELINQFNYVSSLVVVLLVNEPAVRNRAILLSQIIALAQQFKELGNFHLLYAILVGVQNASVSRLKWTWKRLSQSSRQQFSELEELMSLSKNMANYREYVSNLPPKTPFIPYVGLVLQSLTFAEENPDVIKTESAPLINFSKQRILWSIINDFFRWRVNQFSASQITIDSTVQSFLATVSRGLTEKESYDLSLQLEPRGALENQIH